MLSNKIKFTSHILCSDVPPQHVSVPLFEFTKNFTVIEKASTTIDFEGSTTKGETVVTGNVAVILRNGYPVVKIPRTVLPCGALAIHQGDDESLQGLYNFIYG